MSNSARVAIALCAFGIIVVSLLIGWWSKKKMSNAQSFFGSTALFGPAAVGLATMSAAASVFAVMGVPGNFYVLGNTINLWILSSGGFAMSYIILGKKMRAMAEIAPISTLGDVAALRFENHRGIKLVFAILIFLASIAYLSSQIKGVTVLFGYLLGWSPLTSALIIFGVLIIYTAISGDVGGLLTQAFQGFVMVIAGIILIISFYVITGGMGNAVMTIAAMPTVTGAGITKTFSPNMLDGWGIATNGTTMAFIIMPMIGLLGQPAILSRMYALKDPRDMPKMGLFASVAHLFVSFLAVVAGMGAMYLVASGKIMPLENADSAILAFSEYVGVIGQIFTYAAVISAALSTSSMFLTMASGMIARDVPDALGIKLSSQKQVTIGRVAMIVLGIATIIFTLKSGSMVAMLTTLGYGTFITATFPVFVIGLLWKGCSKEGAFSGLLVSLILNITCMFLVGTGIKWPGGLPWYMNVIALSILVTIVVSLFTKGAKGDALDPRVKAAMEL
ncbi:sodium:solute symporter family transporter [Fusibacter ferrireducens]|uniref:Sodium:proline symporter n=1 Tax=Fusibacter ferrireducens TaxID=2785058 RepID=A0ABR9ZVA3_9FIRM|nr:sodium:proline symporter [Fusibacter ferrireducens]MBF4694379.1 sodium:proline symporter [Fusibacter ferrireducens]